MLWFVGTGVSGYDSIPARGLEVIGEADLVYMEQFTSPVAGEELSRIRRHVRGEFRPAKRWLVEDGDRKRVV